MKLNLIVICLIVSLFSGCASGSHTLTGTARPAISPSLVRIYQTSPTRFEVVGIVVGRGQTGGQMGNDNAVAQLKSNAAAMGANGVTITTTTLEPFTGLTGHSTVLTGQAIFVP